MVNKNKVQKLCSSLLILASVSSVSLVSMPVMAMTRADDLKDVKADHWAYKAIKDLVDKYGIMGGYPDGTFRGSRTFTRYEAAAALAKVMEKIEEMMGNQPQTTSPRPTVSNDDLKTLKDLTEEFRRELDAMKAANSGQYAKIKSLEDDLEKVKKDFGAIKFSGAFDSGFDDTIEDNFRPAYYADYDLGMNVTVSDTASISAKFSGNFNSSVTEKEENGVKKKADVEESKLGFGQAWFNYSPANLPLNPKVKFGYMSLGNLISAKTSIKHYFGDDSSTSLANPNLNSGAKKRGIRITKSVSGGVEVGTGPFTFTLAANPQIFAAQAKLDFGLVKIKFDADADQTLFVGEIVQDPIHDEALVVDIGNDTFGTSFQANFRGVADDWQWRAASGLLYLNVFGFEVGGVGKFENESSQQIVAGGFIKTPGKLGTTDIPSLTFAIQEPLTLLNGTIYEGSNLGDKAGIDLELSYDNPFLPGFTIYYQQKTNILFSDDPKDTISNTYGISSSLEF